MSATSPERWNFQGDDMWDVYAHTHAYTYTRIHTHTLSNPVMTPRGRAPATRVLLVGIFALSIIARSYVRLRIPVRSFVRSFPRDSRHHAC